MNTLVTSQYQPRLSSIAKKFSRQISQSDCSIQIKLNYFFNLTDDLKTHKSRLEQEITDLCSKHEREKTGIVDDNEKALAAEIVKFTLEKTRALQIGKPREFCS
jgi:hypothetical protein